MSSVGGKEENLNPPTFNALVTELLKKRVSDWSDININDYQKVSVMIKKHRCFGYTTLLQCGR